jgi:hypothetical protein
MRPVLSHTSSDATEPLQWSYRGLLSHLSYWEDRQGVICGG